MLTCCTSPGGASPRPPSPDAPVARPELPRPSTELDAPQRRLLDAAESSLLAGEPEAALEAYESLLRDFPHSAELLFLVAVCLSALGALDEALPLYAAAFERRPPLREAVPRLSAEGLLPDDLATQARIQSATRE